MTTTQAQLSVQLREQTRAAHERMERTLNLLAPGFALDDYTSLLKRWYGFHETWEPLASKVFGPDLEHFLADRRKLPMLQADLVSLGVSDSALATLPRADFPADRSPATSLGTLYVIEGSTLGGQVVTRKMHERFGLTPATGVAYFASYGSEIGKRWQETKSLLDQSGLEPSEVINGARQTFDFLEKWLAK